MFLYISGKPIAIWKFGCSEGHILPVCNNGCILNISHNLTSPTLSSVISHYLIKFWLLLIIYLRGLAFDCRMHSKGVFKIE